MYLLNPKIVLGNVNSDKEFTFHYVSIKSYLTKPSGYKANKFTFHYVSIKSGSYIYLWR